MCGTEGNCKVERPDENLPLHQGNPACLSQSVEDSVARPRPKEILEVRFNQDDNQE